MSDKTETQQPTEGGSTPRTCSEPYPLDAYVEVLLPDGWRRGKIVKNLGPYGLSGEVKYEIRGDEFTSISSARSIKKLQCGNCQHWIDDDHCKVNFGITHDTDYACSLYLQND